MRRIAVCIASLFAFVAAAQPAKRPNVIFILADDLGYGDVGIFYQNARVGTGKPSFVTPHLDALAESGIILRQHYTSSPVCAPARASLMTGQSQGHCAIRDNEFDKPIPPDTLTLASVMKQAGYHTAIIGKWGLGGKKGSDYPAHPMKRGFDEFFGFMLHATGHVYYHDDKHPLMEGMQDIGNRYENVYSTDLFTARAKKFITDEHTEHPERPFFLYLAYTAVHNALNVPGEPYPQGGGKTGGLQWPLKPTPQTRNTWIHPDYANQSWTEPMKRYATMARRLDDGVGDIMKLLADLNIADDTLVIFTSDNGPANEGGADPRLFDSWGPFDGFKRDCFEGGVREPTFVSWPGHVPEKRISDFPCIFYDWMPTLAELAGVAAPAQSDGLSILPTILGTGQQREHPFLYGEYFVNLMQPAARDVFARKHTTGRGQQQFVRIGDFVGVRTQIKKASDPLRLYDVMKDPHEDHNLAKEARHTDLLKRMTELLVTARHPEAGAARPYDDTPMPAVEVNDLKPGGLKLSTYEGQWPWTPDFTTMKPSHDAMSKTLAVPPQPPAGPFGLQFEGYIAVPADGAYTFTATSDRGVHLWLHDAHVIDEDNAQPGHAIKATVHLRAGWHPIRLAYWHTAGEPALTLRYSGNGGEGTIPPESLATGGTSK